MAVRIVWSSRARKDLSEIRNFIGRDNPTAAKAVIRSIEEKVESLANFPESGRAIPGQKTSSLRELIFRPYRIPYFYLRDKNEMLIVRVWHGARGEPDLKVRA